MNDVIWKGGECPTGAAWPEVRSARMRGETALELTLHVGPGVSWFEGHFPGRPVLPGIVQLLWAIGFGRAAWRLPVDSRRVENLKFQHPVLPGAMLELRLDFDPSIGRLGFEFNAAGRPCSRGRVYLS